MKRILLWALLIAALLSATASALEISPTKRIVDFTPSATTTGTFTLKNTAPNDLRLVLSAKGELAPSLTLSDFIIELGAGEEREVSYTLRLPESIDKPGTHDAEIVVLQEPTKSGDGAFVGTAISLSTFIRVRVPYPGTYLETRLEVSEANVNESVTFVLPVTNLGKEDILSAQGTVKILGPTSQVLGTLKTPEKPIKARSSEELISSWLAQVEPGIYLAQAQVAYDGRIAQAERKFAVGNLIVEITGATVDPFKLGGIAKISLSLENRWNQDIDALYAELFVYDSQGAVIYQTKSASVPIKAQGNAILPVFWDTKGLPSGSYPATVVLHYADKSNDKSLKLVVGATSMEALLLSPTGQVVSEKAGSIGLNGTSIFILLQVALIAGNIVITLWLKRRKKDGV